MSRVLPTGLLTDTASLGDFGEGWATAVGLGAARSMGAGGLGAGTGSLANRGASCAAAVEVKVTPISKHKCVHFMGVSVRSNAVGETTADRYE